MEFCPECHALLLVEASSSGGRLELHCSRCNHIAPFAQARERVVTAPVSSRPKAVPQPMQQRTEALCERCGNNEAFFVQLQTRSADEPATQFFTCTKCDHKCVFCLFSCLLSQFVSGGKSDDVSFHSSSCSGARNW